MESSSVKPKNGEFPIEAAAAFGCIAYSFGKFNQT